MRVLNTDAASYVQKTLDKILLTAKWKKIIIWMPVSNNIITSHYFSYQWKAWWEPRRRIPWNARPDTSPPSYDNHTPVHVDTSRVWSPSQWSSQSTTASRAPGCWKAGSTFSGPSGRHRRELPVIRCDKIMVIYPYPFLMVITQLFS